jgi:hypothetical protein
MRMTVYAIHIIAGSIGLLSGYVALSVTKGASLHRRSGIVFVCAMLTMCFFGTLIAIVRGVAPAINIPAGVLTAYLVITALTTVRPAFAGTRWMGVGAMMVAFIVGVTMLGFGFRVMITGVKPYGIPPFPFFMFGVVGLLGSVGDVRVMRSGALRGAPRLARHLWRMCFALFIAAMSFFIGQAKVVPKQVRIYPLLALPVLIVLVATLYWLWRVRVRRSFRGIVGPGLPEILLKGS